MIPPNPLSKLLFVMACCLAVVSPVNAGNTELDKLLGLVNERLQLMKEVAAYKHANNISIENKQREEVVLHSAIAMARAHHLKPASVESFFRLQIEFAKAIQKGWIKNWRAEGAKPLSGEVVPDLAKEIRPKLITLGEQIVEHIYLALPELHNNAQFSLNLTKIESAISARFISTQMKRQLLHALVMIQTQGAMDNHLAEILRRGELRVGTTGDYEPFSFSKSGVDNDTDNITGIDIDLAENLAASLGVKLKLVKTSWPTLMVDYSAQQFDIGMSGISRTLLRQRQAFFSDKYYVGGKTAIGRCAMAADLNSLGKIDQPNIRVIVNPGGTNEKFVRQHIHRAQVIVHPDNRTVFHQILESKADVMFTDDIEVKLQHRLHPMLCGTLTGELLSYSEKGFLLPQDMVLKEYVDAWLEQITLSGKLETIFAKYM